MSLIARMLVARPLTPPMQLFDEAAIIEVHHGSWVGMLCPDDIDQVSAADNYIELYGCFGSVMARRTMADLGLQLSITVPSVCIAHAW